MQLWFGVTSSLISPCDLAQLQKETKITRTDEKGNPASRRAISVVRFQKETKNLIRTLQCTKGIRHPSKGNKNPSIAGDQFGFRRKQKNLVRTLHKKNPAPQCAWGSFQPSSCRSHHTATSTPRSVRAHRNQFDLQPAARTAPRRAPSRSVRPLSRRIISTSKPPLARHRDVNPSISSSSRSVRPHGNQLDLQAAARTAPRRAASRLVRPLSCRCQATPAPGR